MVRILSLILIAVVAVFPAFAADKDEQKPARKPVKKAEKKADLSTQKAKTSYAVGYNMGMGLKQSMEIQPLDLDVELIKRGLADAMADTAAALTKEEMRDIILGLQQDFDAKRQEVIAKQQQMLKEQGEKNKAAGERFLKENAAKEGVKVLPSGLQYKVIKEGVGRSPSPSDTVTVNYRGTLINGKEFDSSSRHGKPMTFWMKQKMIKGWTEGIQLMKQGGKAVLYIPPQLGYEEQGAGQVIGPNATLIFEVELLEIGPPQAEGESK